MIGFKSFFDNTLITSSRYILDSFRKETARPSTEGKITKNLPPIIEQTEKRLTLERRARDQALTYTLWKTPPLRSVYIRWKSNHSSVAFCDVQTVMGFFRPYGPIERVVYSSPNSAIVVFNLIRSACSAAANASQKYSQYSLFVVWLPQYLQVPMEKSFRIC